MRVAQHVVDARRRRLAELLQRHRYVEIADLCKEFGVSEATVRRDLVILEKNNLITRTYGGALADFNLRFPSFRRRRGVGSEGKRHIAQQAHSLLRPELTVYLDGGTTLFALAECLRENPIRPLTCVTCNLPVADLLSEIEGVAVHLLGGQILGRQSVLLGEEACRNAAFWHFDLAFLGAEGMTREGLWNSTPTVVELQHAVCAQTRCKVALLDRSKLGRTAPAFLGGWDIINNLLTDAPREALDAENIPSDMMEVSHIRSVLQPVTQDTSVASSSKVSPTHPEEEDNSLPTSLL